MIPDMLGLLEGLGLTPGLLGLMALIPLVILLIVIAWQDIRSRRIPNKLVLIGVVSGIVLNGLLPEGSGFNNVMLPGGVGWLPALQGLGIGMAVLLPLYLLRAMGAGDVKLMAMVGAFLGPGDTLGALLATFVAGGVMALIMALVTKRFGQLMQNIKLLLLGGMVKMSTGQAPLLDELPVSIGKLPYAVAIATGTLAYLLWQRIG